jgi:hypothetical protein
MRAVVLLLSVLAAASCARNALLEPELGAPFTLRAGQEAAVAGTPLRLRFVGVPEDSRCPVDVVCFWEGDAEVHLLVGVDAPPEAPLDLHTSTHIGERTAIVGGYRIELQRVAPARRSDRPNPGDRYQASFLISRAP